MIPPRNKDLLIENLKKGYTILEACKASQVSKASLYRLFKTQPSFKEDVEQAIFKSKDASKEIEREVERRNMEQLKRLIVKR